MSGSHEDDDDDDATQSDHRYIIMPTLQSLQIMRNLSATAGLGKRLMKWKAVAASGELRGISEKIVASAERVFSEDLPTAYMMLARCRYLDPDFHTFILEDVKKKAHLSLTVERTYVAGIKIRLYTAKAAGRPPYELLSLPKAGRLLQETAVAFQKLASDLVSELESRLAFVSVYNCKIDALRKMNVMGKVVIPRAMATISYIQNEMEEREREEYFRMKKIIYIKNKRIESYSATLTKDTKRCFEREKSYSYLRTRSEMGLRLYEMDSDSTLTEDDDVSVASFGEPAVAVPSPKHGRCKKAIGFSEAVLPSVHSQPRPYAPPETVRPLPAIQEYVPPATMPEAPSYPFPLPAPGVSITACGGCRMPLGWPETWAASATQAAAPATTTSPMVLCMACRIALLILAANNPLNACGVQPTQTPIPSAPPPMAIAGVQQTQMEVCGGPTTPNAVSQPTSATGVRREERAGAAAGPLAICAAPDSRGAVPEAAAPGVQQTQAAIPAHTSPTVIDEVRRTQAAVSATTSPAAVYGGRTTPSVESQPKSPTGVCCKASPRAAAAPLAAASDSQRAAPRPASPAPVSGGRELLTPPNVIPKTLESYGRYVSTDCPSTRDRGTAVPCRRCAASQEEELHSNVKPPTVLNADDASRGQMYSDNRGVSSESSIEETARFEINLEIPHFLLRNGIKIVTDFIADSTESLDVARINSREISRSSSDSKAGIRSIGAYQRGDVTITEIEDMGCQCNMGRDEQATCPKCRLENPRNATIITKSSESERNPEGDKEERSVSAVSSRCGTRPGRSGCCPKKK